MTARYALVGSPLDGSPSPAMHNAAFRALGIDARYVLRPAGLDDLPAVIDDLRRDVWQGLNVTTPLKTAVAAQVTCDDLARRAGAVNTVYQRHPWLGALTDVPGVLEPLQEAGVRAQDQSSALVLGAGGAARAAVLALEALGAEIHVAARRPGEAARVLADLAPRRAGLAVALGDERSLSRIFPGLGVVIQATPVGRAGDRHVLPWRAVRAGFVALDMIYRPRTTPFLQEAAAAGGRLIEGWQMLVAQAAHSFTLWSGRPAPRAVMQDALLVELGH